jgi:hypothetical protein
MGLARRWETRLQQWEETLPGHSWRRAREVDLPTQTLALAAQFVLCAAPLLVAISAVVRLWGSGSLLGL